MFPVRPQFTRATRKAALTCLLRLSPLLCPCVHSSPAPFAKPHSRAYRGCRRFFALRASTVHPRHSQSRTLVLTAAVAASLLSAPFAKPHSRAYRGYRRFFARASTVHPRHSQSRTHVLTAAIAASLLIYGRSLRPCRDGLLLMQA